MASQFQKDQDYFYNQNLGTTNKLIKDRQTANTNMTNQYIADQNDIVDKSVANAVDKVNTQISGLPTQYQSAFGANAIQQKINERQTAEHMANMGLTDSGLNRTQQTAFAVQRSNADAALRQQLNAATVSLKQQIADLYASGETQKMQTAADAKYQLAQTNQSVYNTYMDNLKSRAYAYAENEANTRAAIEKERIKAEQAQREKYEKWALENGVATYNDKGRLVLTGNAASSSSKKTIPTEQEYDEVFNMYVMEEGYKNPEKFIKNILKKYPGYDTDAIIDYLEAVTMVSDGGGNYGPWYTLGFGYGGIDNNGSISFGNKNTTTMAELYDRLVDAGYNKDIAEKMVINYQHYMGI